MPGMSVVKPDLHAVTSRCCDVAATHPANPAGNPAAPPKRAPLALYLEFGAIFPDETPVSIPSASHGDPCPEAWRARWRGQARRARSASESDQAAIRAAE